MALSATILITSSFSTGDLVSFNGVNYFFGIEEKEWEAAENDCVTRGGHLTSIFSREENDFLFQQIQQKWFVKNAF